MTPSKPIIREDHGQFPYGLVDFAASRLNLGSSDESIPGFISVDIAQPCDFVWDLRKRWPWENVAEIRAHHVGEHIDNADFPGNKGKIWFMNEAHRVLMPGGILDLEVPAVMTRDGRVCPGAFCDPTHVSFWTPDDRYYFGTEWNNPRDERGRLGPAYGITALFDIVKWEHVDYGGNRSKICAILKACK